MSNTPAANINSIAKLLGDVKFLGSDKPISLEEAVTNISNNIRQFEAIKQQYIKLYVDNHGKLMNYKIKIDAAKRDHTKIYFNKKIKKYQSNVIQILEKMTSLDKSIENLTTMKRKLEAKPPVEPVVDIPQTIEV